MGWIAVISDIHGNGVALDAVLADLGRRDPMNSVTSTPPPDDSGTDAFQRYGYQAQIAFPFCLRCYFEGDVVAIYCEHWEDLLIEYADWLRFVQIKTRNPSRGPWKYRHLLDRGGALRSLLRTHRALAAIDDPRAIEYEVRLEGAVDGTDQDVARLLVGGDGPSDGMCASCSDRLGIEQAEARALLARVTMRPNEPARGLIEANNRDALRLIAGHLSANDLKDVYDAAIDVIRRAMEAELLADAWNALNATGICHSSSAHRRFQEWERAGVFHEIWRQGLLDYDDEVGIDWAWLAADGAMTKAPLGGPKTGPNPTDRAKKGRSARSSPRLRGSRSGSRTRAPSAMTKSS